MKTPAPNRTSSPGHAPEPYESRLQAFVLYCLGFTFEKIVAESGVSQPTISRWKKKDNWDVWRAALAGKVTGIPGWMQIILKEQAETSAQLKELNTHLASLLPPA